MSEAAIPEATLLQHQVRGAGAPVAAAAAEGKERAGRVLQYIIPGELKEILYVPSMGALKRAKRTGRAKPKRARVITAAALAEELKKQEEEAAERDPGRRKRKSTAKPKAARKRPRM